MNITRLRFRIAEMVFAPLSLVAVDGLTRLAEGMPFMTDFLLGAAIAVMLLRALDAMRAAANQWPEND